MLNQNEIMQTIQMIDQQHLDVRTITMGISLLSCARSDPKAACDAIYDKITRYAENLVATGEAIEKEFGIPIVNKRISVTPIALVAAAAETKNYAPFAVALDKAAKTTGVNFIGGFSALVQKGMTEADRNLIASIPEALSTTDLVCSSVNVGSTKAGIDMDAVALMGRTIKELAERTADRGEGHCRMPALPVLARAALHHWEEPPISGTRGSGTIFFSGCSLGCVFCQNEVISHRDFGKPVTLERLGDICRELYRQGAHNLNFVNPTHYAHVLMELLRDKPVPLPVVWNTGGYERLETLRALEGLVDIYLPDLKYLNPDTARRYSGAEDYPEMATAAIREMVRQTGPCQFDENGLLTRGVIIRHLILPGQAAAAKDVMDWVAREFPRGTVLFSLMSPYTPWGDLTQTPEFSRRLRRGEIETTADYMRALDLPGFCQERTSAREEYTPPFDLTGV